MSEITNAIEAVGLDGKDNYIEARDEKQAESLRVMAFNAKKKIHEALSGDVGIQKVERDGKWYVRFYRRSTGEQRRFIMSEDGELVPVADASSGLAKILRLMKEDGSSEEEIEAYIRDYKEQHT